MRKSKLLALGGIVVALSALSTGGLVACKKPVHNNPEDQPPSDYNDEYDWEFAKPFVGEKDADMTIDGVLDESRWQDKNWLYHKEKGVNLSYTTAFTEKGLYIAAIAEDENMQWNDIRSFYNNSSFRFYIVSNVATQYYCFDCMSFYVDEKNCATRFQTPFDAKAVRSENDDGVPTLTAEFFATWEDLHYEVDSETGMPEYAKIVPMYRYVENFKSADNAFLKPVFTEIGGTTNEGRINNNLKFGKNGYINVDVEGAELGNAANGFAKSDGWDLTNILGDKTGEKSVRTTVEHGQAIFFKGIYSSRYVYSVDMKIHGAINDLYPSGGVCDMKSATEFNCLRIVGEDFLKEDNPSLSYHLLNFYVGGWEDVRYGNRKLNAGETDKINIKVIKDDTKYYYILNGEYAFSKDIDWLGGKTCPGLYTLGCDAEYTNWQVTDLEGASNDAKFEAELNKYVYKIDISDKISGGAITTDKLAVLRTGSEKIKLNVKPTKGYILTDLKINGQSVYDTLIPTMTDGTIEITVDKNLSVDATFTSLPLQNCVRISGALKANDGNPIINMPYEAKDGGEHSELLYSSGLSTANGMFDIYLLRAGTYTIGGRTIKSSGVYDLNFDGVVRGYKNKTIHIDTKDAQFAGSTYRMDDLVFEGLNIGGNVYYSDGSVATSETDGWDLSGYESGELIAKHGSAGRRLYFAGNATEHAIINVTFNHKGTAPASVTAEQPMAGVSMRAADGTYYSVMIFNNKLCVMPNSVWENNLYPDPENSPGYNLTDQKDTDLSFCFIKTDDNIFVFYKKGNDWLKIFDVKDARIDGEKAFSFMVNESADYDWSVAFKNYSIERSNDRVDIESTLKNYLGRTLTIGNGVSASVNGKPVLGGSNNVMLGDTVTLSMNITSGQKVAFKIDGEQIATVINGNTATATFTVTDNASISYDTAYDVTGTVTGGNNNTTVTIVNDSGSVVYSAKGASINAILSNGTYYATAVGNSKVSQAYRFTVSGGAVNNVNLTLSRSALDVTVGSITFDKKTGEYKTAHGDTANIGYFGSVANGTAYVLRTEMKDMSSDLWPSAGFAIGTGTNNYMKFTVRYVCEEGNKHYDLLLQGFNGSAKVEAVFPIPDSSLTQNIFTNNGKAALELVYNNGRYYFFVGGKMALDCDENTVYGGGSIKDAVGNGGKVKLGLFAERQITFVDWSDSSERSALEQAIGATVNIQSGLTVTVGGVNVSNGGKILLGDTVKITKNVGVGNKISVKVNGTVVSTTILNGVATAEFTAMSDKIDIVYDDAYYVSGTVVGGDSNTVITIVDDMRNVVYTTNGSTYKATLANGTYYITAASDTKVSNAATVTVNGGDVTAASVKLDKIKLTQITGEMHYDVKTGHYITPSVVTDNRMLLGKVAQGDFAIEAVIDNISGGEQKYPCAGFRIQTGGENYLYFNLRYNDDAQIYQYWLKRWPFGDYKNIEKMLDFEDGSYLRTNPFQKDQNNPNGKPLKITLMYKSGVYYMFFNDVLTFTLDETSALNENGSIADAIGNGERELVLFAERAAEFSDWSYTTDLSRYEKTISIAAGITAKVGNAEVRDKDKVKVGDTVTVTKTVNAGEAISFYVNGKRIDTVISNGVATARFIVTDNCSVTCSTSYVVSGSVTGGNDSTIVKLLDENGKETYIGNGKDFSIAVANGTYYLSAEHDGKVSEVKKITVNGAAVSETLTTNKIKPQLVAGEFNYDFKTGNYSTPQSIPDNQATIATVAENTAFAVSTVVKNMGTADCPAVGFRINVNSATEQYMFFRLRYDSAANVYQCWLKRGAWQQYAQIEKLTTFKEDSWMRTTPFKDNGQLKITLVYKEGVYYMLFNGEITFAFDENGKLNDNGTISDALGSGVRELRLAAECAVTFVDWDFTTDAAKITELIGTEKHPALYEGNFQYNADGSMSSMHGDLKNVAYFDEVSADGPFMVSTDIKSIGSVDWPSAGLVVGTSRTNYIRFTVRHTCDADPHYDLLLRGYKGELNDQTHKVEAVFPFSDSALTNNIFASGNARLKLYYKDGKYYITVNDSLQFAFDENAVYGNGSIKEAIGATDKVMLGVFSEGEATFENFASTTDATAINNALGTKPIPAISVGSFTYNTDGSVSTKHDDTNNLAYLGSVNKSAFKLEMSIKNMSDTAWPSVGMTIGVSNSQWLRFSIVRNTDANVYIFRVADQNGKQMLVGFGDIDAVKDNKPFGENGTDTLKVTLIRETGKFTVNFNDGKVWEFADTAALGDTTVGAALGNTDKVNLYLFAERSITFTDWSYTENV